MYELEKAGKRRERGKEKKRGQGKEQERV